MESNSWPHAGHPKNHTIHLRILSECFSNLNRLLLRPLPWGPFQSSIIHSNAQPLSGWKTFPDIQPTPTLTQLHTISSSPVTGHRSEETCYLLLLVPRVKDSIVYYHCFLVICHLPCPTEVSAVQFYYLWRGDTQVQKLPLAEPRHHGSCMKYSLSYDCAEIGKQKCFSETV